MGGSHTQIVVTGAWKAAFGNWHVDLTGDVNEVLRKVGHFIGYGLIGLLFRSAWYKSAQAFSGIVTNWLLPVAAALAVISTFAVACLDEWHQTFLPGRVGCLSDALLDGAGALFLNLLFWAYMIYKRRKALSAWVSA
ncbi:MAG TPA: VanZ family protein [Acidobacteriaceae bacterium]